MVGSHLQDVCYFRQQPTVLIAKYHPVGNHAHCRMRIGLNTRLAICHSPTSAINTQVHKPESLYPKKSQNQASFPRHL